MCGIAGILALNTPEFRIETSQIVAMCDAMAHRGPDGEGYLFAQQTPSGYLNHLETARPEALLCIEPANERVFLGHRRLAIIDLSAAAAQPMTDATAQVWIVFNGEIYNHKDIKKELLQLGYHFKTDHSDTEVILNAYLAWGIECVKKFRGMFAFGLWDKTKNEFYLLRDRMGVKPLYYTIHNDVLYFASEIKAILENKEIPRKLHKAVVSDYLSFTAAAAPDTFFENIHKLHAAHYIKINLNNGDVSAQIRYWDMFEAQTNDAYKGASSQDLLACFTNCVDIRREADVQYGVLLSGGIDSSANAITLSKLVNKPIKAFTVGFSNQYSGYKNEFEPARQVAKLCNAQHYELELSQKDFLDFLPQMVWHQDEPTADAANIPIYYISKLAKKEGVTVILGGEGSDELLIGYSAMQNARRFSEFLGQKKPMKQAGLELLLGLNAVRKRKFSEHIWLQNAKESKVFYRGSTDLMSEQEKRSRVFSAEFSKTVQDYNVHHKFEQYYHRFEALGRSHFYDWASYIELNYRLPELLLNRLDKMTMAASVEGRVPFLDVRFVEMAMGIAASEKVQHNQEKYLLKKAFEGILPQNILHRPKDGFTIPLTHLLTNDLLAMGKDALLDFNRENEVFSAQYLKSITQPTKNNLAADKLWTALNLALWWQRFLK